MTDTQSYFERTRDFCDWAVNRTWYTNWVYGPVDWQDKTKCNLVLPFIDFVDSLMGLTSKFEPMDLLIILFWVFIGALVYGAWSKSAVNFVRQNLYYVRGVYVYRGEAMVEGSSFSPVRLKPMFQVEIYSPGTIVDTFLGYGLRLGDVLVLPMHVYYAASGTELLLAGNKGKVVLTINPISSRRVSDVGYVPLEPKVWSKMGVAVASVLEASNRPLAVSITGREGISNGYANKEKTPFILRYNGSTAPGYSGAAYVSNGAAYGMHLGESNGVNVGVSLEALMYEIKTLIKGESNETRSIFPIRDYRDDEERDVHSSAQAEKQKKGKEPKPKWESRDIQRDYDDDDDWGEDDIDAYWEQMMADRGLTNKDLYHRYSKGHRGESALPSEIIDSFKELSQAQIKAIAAYATSLCTVRDSDRTTRVRFTPHSDGPSFADVLSVNHPVPVGPTLEERVEMLESRVSLLETANTRVTAKQPAVLPYPCGKCAKSFSSKMGMLMHNYAKHNESEQEHFLGESSRGKNLLRTPIPQRRSQLPPVTILKDKTSPSTKPSSSSSSLGSSQSGTINPAASSTSDQSATRVTQQELRTVLQQLQGIISGLNLESTQ